MKKRSLHTDVGGLLGNVEFHAILSTSPTTFSHISFLHTNGPRITSCWGKPPTRKKDVEMNKLKDPTGAHMNKLGTGEKHTEEN